jgi:hypothetical protein
MFEWIKKLWQSFSPYSTPVERPRPQLYKITLQLKIFVADEKSFNGSYEYDDIHVDYDHIMQRFSYHLLKNPTWYSANVLFFQRPRKVIITKVTTEKI